MRRLRMLMQRFVRPIIEHIGAHEKARHQRLKGAHRRREILHNAHDCVLITDVFLGDLKRFIAPFLTDFRRATEERDQV